MSTSNPEDKYKEIFDLVPRKPHADVDKERAYESALDYINLLKTPVVDVLKNNNIHVYSRQKYENSFYFNAHNSVELVGYIKDDLKVTKYSDSYGDLSYMYSDGKLNPFEYKKVLLITPITKIKNTSVISIITTVNKDKSDRYDASFNKHFNVNGYINPSVISVSEKDSFSSSNYTDLLRANTLNLFKDEFVITKEFHHLVYHMFVDWYKNNRKIDPNKYSLNINKEFLLLDNVSDLFVKLCEIIEEYLIENWIIAARNLKIQIDSIGYISDNLSNVLESIKAANDVLRINRNNDKYRNTKDIVTMYLGSNGHSYRYLESSGMISIITDFIHDSDIWCNMLINYTKEIAKQPKEYLENLEYPFVKNSKFIIRSASQNVDYCDTNPNIKYYIPDNNTSSYFLYAFLMNNSKITIQDIVTNKV